MPREWSDEEYFAAGKEDLGETLSRPQHPGKSPYSDQSDWRDFHLAVQRAAALASNSGEEGWHNVALQVWVGNPNVKVYRAVLVKPTVPPDPPDDLPRA